MSQGNSPLVSSAPRININLPRYDQSTFVGRAKHFFETANPLNLFASNAKLAEAAEIVNRYRRTGDAPPGLTVDQLWRCKVLYDSAYHPDTGEKMFLIGRMSAQVPMNMTIIGCMLTFYKSPGAVIFWQWVNQSFNACVNYTNRSGDNPVTMRDLAVPYVAATTAATVTALGLNVVAKRLPPIVGRFVPFTAVAAANAINLPLMRERELRFGVSITDENDNKLGTSKNAGAKGIAQVVLSRIVMAMPSMVIPPIIMNSLEKKGGILTRYPFLNAPMQILLTGFCLVFSTPLCCAIFPQKSSMLVSSLEEEVRTSLQRTHPNVKTVYFNKGL